MTRTFWSRRWHDGPALVDTDTGEAYWRPTRLQIDLQLDTRHLFVGLCWHSHPTEREFVLCLIPCIVITAWWTRHRPASRAARQRRTA